MATLKNKLSLKFNGYFINKYNDGAYFNVFKVFKNSLFKK